MELKIGMKVRIVPHGSGNNNKYDETEGFDNCWVDSMDALLNTEQVIVNIRQHGVSFGDKVSDYLYPPLSLRVVK